MTLAGFFILTLEATAIYRLYSKYFREGEVAGATVEEFLSRATLEDIIKMNVHQAGAFYALCIMTMGRLFN